MREYDIIVVGAGHAGCEAAASGARLGSKVLLVTMNMSNMAQMSCNPSIGGIAKGQMIREIDALGGFSGIVTDKTMIQFRMLNRSKGPAMWSPRAQSDRVLYSMEWRNVLESTKNVDFLQDSVVNILIKSKRIVGVVTRLGKNLKCKSVILASGTFLNGVIHIGEKSFSGGRIGEGVEDNLTSNLIKKGFVSKRMKTGTPVRVDGRTLNFNRMEEQQGDADPGRFSYAEFPKLDRQKSCYLTYTNVSVHNILRTGFDKSPMFTGRIQGRGPRYCPSIEDKIDRFATKERHQLFIEPEGWNTIEYYVNGFSSSLPEEIQYKALKKVSGFEKAKFFRPGYAIEYDYFPPFQLKLNLETKIIENLFFAGQINGTTGYEEAAAQGLLAGINAHLKINKMSEFILKRSDAYLGVLIDDLVTKGTEEPYRMFTSRAEYRILLRQDNADYRLTEKSFSLGLISGTRYDLMKKKYDKVSDLIAFLKRTNIAPEEINGMLERQGTNKILQKQKAAFILLRPQVDLREMVKEIDSIHLFAKSFIDIDDEVIEQAEIQIKYEEYIRKEKELVEKMVALENITLKEGFDYMKIQSLSYEAREKLLKIQPQTLGQAARISGVSPSDISVLLVHFGR